MKYPIGIQDFKSIVDGGFVYVDKTALLHKMVTDLTSSLRTPRNINLTIFLGKNAKNRAFLV